MEIIRRKDAIAKGLVRYFTAKPCKRGHVVERHTIDGQCLECSKTKTKIMRVKHRDKRLAYEAEYRKNNRDLILQRSANWRKNNPDAIKEYSKKYYWENLQACTDRTNKWKEQNYDYVLQRRKEYYENNLQKCRASSKRWKDNNRERVSIYNAMKRPERDKRLKAATPEWVDRSSIVIKYKERDCLNRMTGLVHHVDHVVPLKGKNICGLHVPWNLRVILARDNLAKYNRWETV